MIELDKDTWYEFVYNFTNRLNANYNVEEALKMFVDDYWSELDNLASQACEDDDAKYKPNYDPEKDFATKKYLEEKNNIIWNYVYALKAEISNLKAEVALLKEANAARTIPYGPIKYPNNIPPTHEYPLDWYKVTAHSNAQDNQRIPGLMPEGFATSGYMQVTDKKYTPKYTQEELEAWSNIRYTPPEGC